jgi:hypothetical protein
MTRSSFALALSLFVFGNLACGDKPPPKPPETTPSTDTDGGDSPKTSSTDSDGGAGGDSKPSTDTTPPPAPAALALPTAAAKLKFKAKKDFDLEVKSDGAVNNGGKPFAKITGMELQGPDGKGQLKVDGDGNITTAEGGAYAKFDGDDLAAQNNTKYSIGEDGALSSTNDKGTKTAMGKSEGVGTAKRAALLSVAFALWGTKAPAAPAAKPAGKTPGEKPAGKTPGKPPAKK